MILVKFSELTPEQKLAIQARLDLRKLIRTKLLRGPIPQRILIVGDRPGNKAPSDPTYHHTPFYSTKYCSGWLNALLEVNGIPEDQLAWINAWDRAGNPTDPIVLSRMPEGSTMILLGGYARKWYELMSRDSVDRLSVLNFLHPQFWKRFKSKEPYPLISTLGTLTSKQP